MPQAPDPRPLQPWAFVVLLVLLVLIIIVAAVAAIEGVAAVVFGRGLLRVDLFDLVS